MLCLSISETGSICKHNRLATQNKFESCKISKFLSIFTPVCIRTFPKTKNWVCIVRMCDSVLPFILLNNKMDHRTAFIIKYIANKFKVKLDSDQFLDNLYFTPVHYHPKKSQISLIQLCFRGNGREKGDILVTLCSKILKTILSNSLTLSIAE